MTAAGRQMVAGMAAGIRSGGGAVAAAARSVAQQAVAAAKASLQIHSPSRVFKTIGMFMDEGMERGIDEGSDKPINSVQRVTRTIVNTAQETVVPQSTEIVPPTPKIIPMPTAKGTTSTTTTNDSHDVININLSVANGNDIDDAFIRELMLRIQKEKELQDIYKYK